MTGAILKERRSLERESDPELRAQGYLRLAERLERDEDFATAAELYALVSRDAPAAPARLARERLEVLQGGGGFGRRLEFAMRRISKDATDPRVILPMFAASTVSGIVKACSYGRLLGAGPWGARFASGALGFAAEVPTFVGSARLLRGWNGETVANGVGHDLASAGLSLASLKLFGMAGDRLSGALRLNLSPITMVLGLDGAQYLEERCGLRPAQDHGSRLAEALSSGLALGLGARLARGLLGPRFAALQYEMEMRSSAAQFRFVSQGNPFTPWAMAVGGPLEIGARPADSTHEAPSPQAAQEVEAKLKGYVLDRSLSEYRAISSLTLLGDLVRNLETRYRLSQRPPRVLDLGSGKGVAARQLKALLGERVRVETLDRYPLGEPADAHHRGVWPRTELEGEYDVILSIFGPHAHHQGDLLPMLEKAISRLAPGGEFVAVLKLSALMHPHAAPLRSLENFSTVRAALERGLALHLERGADAPLWYARRLDGRTPPPLNEVLQARPEPVGASEYLGRRTRLTVNFAGQTLGLSDLAADRLVRHLKSLGLPADPEAGAAFAQGLLEDFRSAWSLRIGREPRLHEVRQWLEGEEPSALWQRTLLVEALLRSPALLKRGGGAALGLGLGIATLLESRIAQAAPSAGEGIWSVFQAHPVLTTSALALFAVGGFELYRAYRRFRTQAPREDRETPTTFEYLANLPAANDVEEEKPVETEKGFNAYDYLETLPSGWVGRRRREIERCLADPNQDLERREYAVERLVRQVIHLKFSPAESLAAVRLLWDLSFDKRLGQAFRETTFMVYRSILGHPRHFPAGASQVYREALRLRHIFSDPAYSKEKRVQAADAYGRLAESFDLDNSVGLGEARMGRKALGEFLKSGELKPGTRAYFYVNGPKLEVEERMRRAGILADVEEH
ncbi:MAG: class I SAM-dependent methyltransferase [bacterium]